MSYYIYDVRFKKVLPSGGGYKVLTLYIYSNYYILLYFSILYILI